MHEQRKSSGQPARVVVADVACVAQPIVNVYLVGSPQAGDRGWALVDAGLPGFAASIRRAADARFGPGARPAAIVMTHGHFDHIGALRDLAEQWDAPVYAHPLELPYLTGRSPYPPPDPAVGGGGMTALAFLYPRGPIDLGGRAQPLPADGSVPAMPGWRWLPTPGHSPGHVSFFRTADRTLIAGDAFVTTKQESTLAALMKPPVVHRPPAYFTPDWDAARRSVQALAALEPEIAVTGHGLPLHGAEMRRDLHVLAQNFDTQARPARGRYAREPARADERGIVAVPPPARGRAPALLAGAVAATLLLALWRRR